MSQTVELIGRPAAPGLAFGPIAAIARSLAARVSTGTPAGERQALVDAMAAAIADLTAMADAVAGESAAILEFQIAMLSDDELAAAAYAAIDRGVAADVAWRGALDAQIEGYAASADEYFRARTADLRDLRDRVLRHLSGSAAASVDRRGAVLAAEDVTPTEFLETNWSAGGGLALGAGSASSHVAMLARARGVPMVVGLGAFEVNGHRDAIVDGDRGIVILSPGDKERRDYAALAAAAGERQARERELLAKPAVTRDGTPIAVMVNIAGPEETAAIDIASCDGIGLMRTEFLFRDGTPLPDEEAQYRAYRRLLEWAGDKPVTIRTLDIGGDKPIAGLTPPGESNPFLGLRGVRLTLARPDVFRVQLRALARAAVHGNLKVMWPMVTVADEHARAVALMDAVVAELGRDGVACRRPPLGMMVEVPAVAIAPELFSDVAFLSIGSNDLTQYVMAAARDTGSVAGLLDAGHPAVLRLIENVVRHGRAHDIEVSLCGDMASEPRHLAALVASGLRTVSVAPAALGRVKAAIAGIGGGHGPS